MMCNEVWGWIEVYEFIIGVILGRVKDIILYMIKGNYGNSF